MSTKAKGKKGKEQDFETFVRTTLGSLQESVNAMKSKIKMMSELNLLKDRVSSNDAKLRDILKEQDSLTLKYEKNQRQNPRHQLQG